MNEERFRVLSDTDANIVGLSVRSIGWTAWFTADEWQEIKQRIDERFAIGDSKRKEPEKGGGA